MRSIPRARRVRRVTTDQALRSAGGASDVADGRTTPVVAVEPSAIWPHPSQQDRFVTIGPDGGTDRAFLQQHLPWLRQQEGVGLLNAPADIDATEAKNNRNAVPAATALRSRQVCPCPSIPWHITIPCTRDKEGTDRADVIMKACYTLSTNFQCSERTSARSPQGSSSCPSLQRRRSIEQPGWRLLCKSKARHPCV